MGFVDHALSSFADPTGAGILYREHAACTLDLPPLRSVHGFPTG
jgi:hypothetical protein